MTSEDAASGPLSSSHQAAIGFPTYMLTIRKSKLSRITKTSRCTQLVFVRGGTSPHGLKPNTYDDLVHVISDTCSMQHEIVIQPKAYMIV